MRRLTLALTAALLITIAAPVSGAVKIGDQAPTRDSFDRRGMSQPTAAQRSAARATGARVTWNRFGTPRSLFKARGWLAEGLTGAPRDAAREFVRRNAALFRLSEADVAALQVEDDHTLPGTDAHVVTFAQRFGDLAAAGGGLLTVGVTGGRVAYASSSVAAPGALAGERRLSAQDAWLRAAASAGVEKAVGDLSVASTLAGFGQLKVKGLSELQQVREVAVPTAGGARRGFEVNVVDNGEQPLAWTMLVDAESGTVLRRASRLDSAADQPNFQYFKNNPPLDGSGTDRRIVGCFPGSGGMAAPCTFDERQSDAATPAAWDRANNTTGNNADTGLSALNPLAPAPDRVVRPTSPTRDYLAPFTNSWQKARCNPSVFAGGIVPATGPNTFGGTNANDINAAIIALFSNHNNMHDWAYDLGFTETAFNMQVDNFGKGGRPGDPELGNAQGGALTGGTPTYTGRDNANQATLQDGLAPFSNMYLWQPVAGAFYPPCVDGDFDMSVIGHEYTHAISNRMVGGADEGLTSGSDGQARAMGESWSDLTAVEFLAEHGYAPSDDENPFAVGAYVTGSKQKGIRNYGMNTSPLNYSNVQGYDGSGMGSPHDDGEIWSAVNFDIREAMIAKYGAGDAATQLACARGQRPADQCPGNRRWMQTVFDAYLLMADGEVTMLEARDAYLAADRMRFGGANQAEAWSAFAKRGFGEKASSAAKEGAPVTGEGGFADTDNPDPVPSFESPLRGDEGTVTFAPVDEQGNPLNAELLIGDYEANVTPVADSDPTTALGSSVRLVPGEYTFIARANGRGAQKFTRAVAASNAVDFRVLMPVNHASKASGASATGDGNVAALIDDTEESNWVANRQPSVEGAQATVKLGGERLVSHVKVSALLRAVDEGDEQDDPGNQNRFTALRKFAIETCTGSCTAAGDFRRIYTSPDDAFPGGVPRPLAPDMILRDFDVPDTRASVVRLVVLANQCTGNPTFKGESEDDPASVSDCTVGGPATPRRDQQVRAAELQAFTDQPKVTVTPSAACASTAGFRSARAIPRGGRLRLRFSRRVDYPVNVAIFRQSQGRRVLANRLVKRFRGKKRSFTFNSRGRLGDGLYFARFRMPTPSGRADFRRTALRVRNGRFAKRPQFYRRASCGLLTSYKLSSAAFGGPQNKRLGIAFRVLRKARVSATVRRGGKVVKRFKARSYKADRVKRLFMGARGRARGDYKVRLTVRRGSRRVVSVLTARRL